MIINFKLFESKYVNQKAYHFTSEYNLLDIIKCDCLKSVNTGYISLTRDKLLYKKSDYVSSEVRIVLDLEKITNEYKITPYQQISNIFDNELKSIKSKWKGFPNRDLTTIEAEEKINTKLLTNLHNYIISIDLKSKDKYQKRFDKNIFEDDVFINYVNLYNIKINYY
jgi:cell division protein FtsI/penicillin-binding protein 2